MPLLQPSGNGKENKKDMDSRSGRPTGPTALSLFLNEPCPQAPNGKHFFRVDSQTFFRGGIRVVRICIHCKKKVEEEYNAAKE